MSLSIDTTTDGAPVANKEGHSRVSGPSEMPFLPLRRANLPTPRMRASPCQVHRHLTFFHLGIRSDSQSALTTHLPRPRSSSKGRKLDDEQLGWYQAATASLGLTTWFSIHGRPGLS
ncbi:hypothetical protein JDV02_009297 [Purpureocillium takamizusanense]|uniref:Uncharacterized protein n=1 Tax=Purpureocillium takamizusanense TaxID=2060973 RepID=A0A9Q8VG12_9HYPO|nr:uncharacterized protein JDV02_009297 [Purpureocillium takamizusanense]UNI23479.1 hypothetical protein JDV02_009297 [Purpureocillium takamizusanense]